jgi:peptidoglycan-associated lipoprotein
MSDVRRCRAGALLAVLLLAVGCSSTSLQSKGEPDPTPDPVAEDQSTDTAVASEVAASTQLESVHFDTDEATLRSDARATLKDHVQAILANPHWGVITVEGHCDERGAGAYNQALGERRARAVKRYLIELGVPSERLTTMSYSSSRPTALGHDESAWRYNRRSEFGKERIASSIRANHG